MFREYRFRFADVCPDDKMLEAVLQITDEEAYQDLLPVVRGVLGRLQENPGIVGGYTICPCDEVDVKNGLIHCGQTKLEVGKRIASYMKEASALAVFVCTAGSLFTDLANEYLKQGDLPEAFIADAIGSVTVENAMDRIQQALEMEMNLHLLKISNRYSPGYCEWHVSGQQALFSLIDDNHTGVTLTASCLMQPIKSVSGIIGIGVDMQKRPYGCSICHSSTCVYRRIKHK